MNAKDSFMFKGLRVECDMNIDDRENSVSVSVQCYDKDSNALGPDDIDRSTAQEIFEAVQLHLFGAVTPINVRAAA